MSVNANDKNEHDILLVYTSKLVNFHCFARIKIKYFLTKLKRTETEVVLLSFILKLLQKRDQGINYFSLVGFFFKQDIYANMRNTWKKYFWNRDFRIISYVNFFWTMSFWHELFRCRQCELITWHNVIIRKFKNSWVKFMTAIQKMFTI